MNKQRYDFVFLQKESRLDSLLHRRARQGDCEGVRQVTWSDPVGGVQVLSILEGILQVTWSVWSAGIQYCGGCGQLVVRLELL